VAAEAVAAAALVINSLRTGKSSFLIGKPTINGPFSIAMLNYQRVVRGFDDRF